MANEYLEVLMCLYARSHTTQADKLPDPVKTGLTIAQCDYGIKLAQKCIHSASQH